MSYQDTITIKMSLFGSPQTGKTQFFNRLFSNNFNENYIQTVGASFSTKNLTVNNKKVNLCVWDTGGGKDYLKLMPMYYKQADIVFFFVEPTNLECVKYIGLLLNQMKTITDDNKAKHFALILNKIDLPSHLWKLSKLSVELIADKYNITYYETSAKEGGNISSIVEQFISTII